MFYLKYFDVQKYSYYHQLNRVYKHENQSILSSFLTDDKSFLTNLTCHFLLIISCLSASVGIAGMQMNLADLD